MVQDGRGGQFPAAGLRPSRGVHEEHREEGAAGGAPALRGREGGPQRPEAGGGCSCRRARPS
eukprot:10022340-Lingulodinium_polyedra.AAC.1